MTATRRLTIVASDKRALMYEVGKTCDRLLEIAHCTRGLALACRGAAAINDSSECEALFELADMIEHKIADARSALVSAFSDAGGNAS